MHAGLSSPHLMLLKVPFCLETLPTVQRHQHDNWHILAMAHQCCSNRGQTHAYSQPLPVTHPAAMETLTQPVALSGKQGLISSQCRGDTPPGMNNTATGTTQPWGDAARTLHAHNMTQDYYSTCFYRSSIKSKGAKAARSPCSQSLSYAPKHTHFQGNTFFR